MEDELTTSSSSSSSLSDNMFMVGFVISNIVGLQYYSGTINGRELVGLVREPLNIHDTNAIRVLNTRLSQVGHIERGVAAVLSPLIDANIISVEGIVPKRMMGNHFKLRCQIHIFAKLEAFHEVESAISNRGLQLISSSGASFGLSEAAAVEEKKCDKLYSVDDIFKIVDEFARKKNGLRWLAPPAYVIKSKLFLHQKKGLWWLFNRENSTELPPFWEEINGVFVNVLTKYQTDKRPEPLRGGILADDMGLGKTLTLLSLIACDKLIGSSCSTADSVNLSGANEMGEGDCMFYGSAGKKLKRGRSSKNDPCVQKKCKIDDSHFGPDISYFPRRKTTLIVCPPSVFSTWITQLEEHTINGSFKVYLYYGERTKNAKELKKYDIVLTTYSTLGAEASYYSPVRDVEWWRIILDEAHLIKNANAAQSVAVTALEAQRRWVVTGTPIQNGAFDLYSLMVFLRFEPFSEKNYWQNLVQRPIYDGNPKGLSRLQVLMGTISLRRTKDERLVGLPPKTIETYFVELSVKERELYDQLADKARYYIHSYISEGTWERNYSTVLSIILRLRQVCTDANLCPPDMISLLPSTNIEDVSNNPELFQKMLSFLEDEDLECPICMSPPTNAIITRCAHLFCHSCISKTIRRNINPRCPLCRHPLSESDLFSPPPLKDHTQEVEDPNKHPSTTPKLLSSKVHALLKLLKESRESKSVVFSQFQKMLVLLEASLKAAGFKTLRLDGSMNAKKRSEVILEFARHGEGEDQMVLLASLRASGVGINLSAASRAYLFEPWWNPAVEEQAMDRVHRIGQTREVKIVRLIARDSIEERILEMQERKKKVARDAFGDAFGRKKGEERDVNAYDLRLLMGL